ncbi:hypothetical protein [Streptomyces sp. PT12]|uniref:hypothetical protein n=1 Tax=Streptomyces sp. PT12 TaxID=1510197 RepID=UPI000DE51EC3|nr:hypothetical protein [Streptomyces sp. PT12]RBM24342.1 hypothetical protein DEH69_00275 [Streptomyces sp. PT12]
MTIRIRVRAVFAARAAALAAAVLWTAAGPAPSAQAHPFGPPSTATISADGSRATITWRAAEDDWVVLGQAVGAFEDPALDTVSTSLTGEQKLQRSPDLRDYLLDRIYITQDGTRCAGEVASLEGLLANGARLSYACPRDVDQVDVTVGALADLNEAYRTVLSAETPANPSRTMLTATDSTRRIDFSWYAGILGNTAALGVAGFALAIVAGAVVLLVVRRRRAVRGRAA